jgi:hypothetical protein
MNQFKIQNSKFKIKYSHATCGWGFYLPCETRILLSTRGEVLNLSFLINVTLIKILHPLDKHGKANQALFVTHDNRIIDIADRIFN